MYIKIKYKLMLAIIFAFSWVGLSTYIAYPWIMSLATQLTLPVSLFLIIGIALLPGLINSFLIAGLLLDKRPAIKIHKSLPPVTILMAAYNEEKCIKKTLSALFEQNYPGNIEVIVIDDGSIDNTINKAKEVKIPKNFTLTLLTLKNNKGKSHALNKGLDKATHDLIITIDADSLVFKDGIIKLVSNLIDSPSKTAAVAGTVLVRNSRTNWITKLQEWDYFLGISVVKRVQSLYQGTLVAQGAFSIYTKKVLKEVGGWSDTVGEDIVLTWKLHELGYKVSYAENAFVFTTVPETYKQFYKQRKRWARGLIEAFKNSPKILIKPRLNIAFVYFNLFFPYLDFIYLFAFVPGIFLSIFFKCYIIAGLLTFLLLPLILIVNTIMFFKQKNIFKIYGLKIRKNICGFLFYMLTYQFFMSPASLAGYLAEFLNFKKIWGTK